MNVKLMNSMKSISKQSEQSDTKKSPSLVLGERNTFTQASWVPLYFNCLGGKWEGQMQLLKAGSLELRIQGLPPIQAGQELQFQCFDKYPASHSQLHAGIIQQVQIQSGSSAWEGTTRVLVDQYLSPNTHRRFNEDHSDLGSFVLGQVVESKAMEACGAEPQAQALSSSASSSTWREEGRTTEEKSNRGKVQSTPVSIQNRYGHSIVAYHDHPTHADLSTLPVVVIAPGYGETKRDYLSLAYYFASNGFHVIRYDHTNHVGESEGRHFDFSLSSMKWDFQATTQFVRQQWPHCPIIGFASSLAARVALKAEAEHSSLNLLVMLVGVVDIQQSVATVHQEDVFANYLNGQVQDSANILGFNVGRHFLQDAVTNNFSTLTTTLEDVQALDTPVLYVSAGKDAWIDREDLQVFKEAVSSRLVRWLDVPEALHRLQENPKNARATYRHIIDSCCEFLAIPSEIHTIQEPNRLDLGRQNRQEKNALQQHSHTDVGEAFWNDYLGHFQSVGKCQDYVQLLDHVFHALGPITPGQRLLDAGCGNGNAGLFLLQALQETKNQPRLISDHPIRYVGIDVIDGALRRAQAHMTNAYRSREANFPAQFPSVHMSWAQVDLQYQLPFGDHQFDRIVSNLVLGYVAHPQAVLRDLYRVLAPGGRMVISNLKPNGDFSGIYQNLVSHAEQQEQKAEARELLNNYGKIRQAEKEGQFRFFDQTEWMNALDSLHCVHAGVYPTFANQAYLIVLEKPAALNNTPLVPFADIDSIFDPFHDFHHALQDVA